MIPGAARELGGTEAGFVEEEEAQLPGEALCLRSASSVPAVAAVAASCSWHRDVCTANGRHPLQVRCTVSGFREMPSWAKPAKRLTDLQARRRHGRQSITFYLPPPQVRCLTAQPPAHSAPTLIPKVVQSGAQDGSEILAGPPAVAPAPSQRAAEPRPAAVLGMLAKREP